MVGGSPVTIHTAEQVRRTRKPEARIVGKGSAGSGPD